MYLIIYMEDHKIIINRISLDSTLKISNVQTTHHKIPNKFEYSDNRNKKYKFNKIAAFFKLQYSFSNAHDNSILIFAILGSLGMGISNPLFSTIFGESVNTFVFYLMSSPEIFMDFIKRICLKFIFIGLGIWAAGFLNIWLWNYNGKTIARRIKEKYFLLLLSQEQGYFDNINVNEYLTKIDSQVKTIQIGVRNKN